MQRLKGLLDAAGIGSHERAASALYGIVDLVWKQIDEAYRSRSAVTEGMIRRMMLRLMEEQGLETDHPPIVGCGRNSGNPHYDFAGDGMVFSQDEVVQLDLWAKEKKQGSIYADISWVGVFGEEPDQETERAWRALREG